MPQLAVYIFYLLNEPGLGGIGIDPGLTLTSFPSYTGGSRNSWTFYRRFRLFAIVKNIPIFGILGIFPRLFAIFDEIRFKI